MIPFLVMLVGALVCAGCLYVLWSVGSRLWKKRLGEALEEDRKTFADDEQVG